MGKNDCQLEQAWRPGLKDSPLLGDLRLYNTWSSERELLLVGADAHFCN